MWKTTEEESTWGGSVFRPNSQKGRCTWTPARLPNRRGMFFGWKTTEARLQGRRLAKWHDTHTHRKTHRGAKGLTLSDLLRLIRLNMTLVERLLVRLAWQTLPWIQWAIIKVGHLLPLEMRGLRAVCQDRRGCNCCCLPYARPAVARHGRAGRSV